MVIVVVVVSSVSVDFSNSGYTVCNAGIRHNCIWYSDVCCDSGGSGGSGFISQCGFLQFRVLVHCVYSAGMRRDDS